MHEITATAHHLAGTVEGISGRSREITDAVREQEQALASLGETTRSTREAVAALARAAQAQLGESRRIRGQADGVGELVATSAETIRRGIEKTELLTTTVETVRDIDTREREVLGRLEREAERLARQARALLAGIERIRPAAGGDAGHRGGGTGH